MYAALMWMIWRCYGVKAAIAVTVCVTLCIIITDQTCSHLLRPIFRRMRPSNPDNPFSEFVHIVNGKRGGAYGFPSCHSANTFALAMFITWFTRDWRLALMLYSWAIITCFSRIFLGVHYPGDLLFGAVVGTVVGFLTSAVACRLTFDSFNRTAIMKNPRAVLICIGTGIALVIYMISVSLVNLF